MRLKSVTFLSLKFRKICFNVLLQLTHVKVSISLYFINN